MQMREILFKKLGKSRLIAKLKFLVLATMVINNVAR